MDDIDKAVNAAVLRIRRQFQGAQASLMLPVTTFAGVPTRHNLISADYGCFDSCAACAIW